MFSSRGISSRNSVSIFFNPLACGQLVNGIFDRIFPVRVVTPANDVLLFPQRNEEKVNRQHRRRRDPTLI